MNEQINKKFEKSKLSQLICYSTDSSGIFGHPEKIVFPKTAEEVRNIIKNSNNIVVRGSGNNIVGACIPDNSVVVDMKKMNKVSYSKGEIYLEPGITIKELNEKLKFINYELPVFSNETDTIGGMIAVNNFGYFGAYGRIKKWVEEIELVNGKSEIAKLGIADLSDVCGMEGITGIITKVKLKVIPIQKRSISIINENNFNSSNDLWKIIEELKSDKEIAMLRLYSPLASKLVKLEKLSEKSPEKHNLVIVYNSDKGEIKNENYSKILNLIKKDNFYLYSDDYYNIDDYGFLFNKLQEFVHFLDRLKIPYIGDLHFNVIYPFFKENNKIRDFVLKKVRELNGRPIKYGIGLKRKNLLDNLQKKITNSVKLRYDPFNKINKGKVIDFVVRTKEEIEKEIRLERIREKELKKELETQIIPEIYPQLQKEIDMPFKIKKEITNEKIGQEKFEEMKQLFSEKIEKIKEIESEKHETEKFETEIQKPKREYEVKEILDEYEYVFKSELEKGDEIEKIVRDIINKKVKGK